MEDINKDIENLEEIINLINEELDKKDKNVSAILDLKDLLSLRNLIKEYKKLEEENKICKEELEKIDKVLNLEAGRAAPYRYEIIESLQRGITQLKKIIDNSIPVSIVEETIEELNKQYDFYNSDRRETKSIAKGYYIAIQKLEELLEKRK